jgi:hypothetical protein
MTPADGMQIKDAQDIPVLIDSQGLHPATHNIAERALTHLCEDSPHVFKCDGDVPRGFAACCDLSSGMSGTMAIGFGRT